LEFQGPGVVSVSSGGEVTASFSADISAAPQELEPLPEPGETGVLQIDASGSSLVNVGNAWFLVPDESAVEQRGFSAAEMVVVSLDGKGGGESGASAAEDVLTIEGELLLTWDPETGGGFLEVWDPVAAVSLELEYGLEQSMDSGVVGLGGFWSACWIRCGLFRSCYVACPRWAGKCARCRCVDGTAVCDCIDCGGGGGGGGWDSDAVDGVEFDFDVASSTEDATDEVLSGSWPGLSEYRDATGAEASAPIETALSGALEMPAEGFTSEHSEQESVDGYQDICFWECTCVPPPPTWSCYCYYVCP
jgi:hypothetical protein